MTEDQIIRLYGKRCAEHCDDCCVCEVWAMHDLIETQAREIERLRGVLGEIMERGGAFGGFWCALAAQEALAGDSHDQ